MIKTVFLLIVVLSTCGFAEAQEWPAFGRSVAVALSDDPSFDWASVEVGVDAVTRREAIDAIRGPNPYMEPDDFHFLDLDDNGSTDVIFNGFTGAEYWPSLIVALSEDDSLTVVYDDYGLITDLATAPASKLLRLRTWHGPLSDSPSELIRELTGRFTADGAFEHRSVWHLSAHLVAPDPADCFAQPVAFGVTPSRYTLRSAPRIDDESERWSAANAEPYVVGNRLAIYGAGAGGEAYCEARDETGRVWWLVSMDTSTPLEEELPIWNGGLDVTPRRLGWMSSRFLTLTPSRP